MNETKIDLTKTDPTKKTNADADVNKPGDMNKTETKPEGMMSSEELFAHIKTLDVKYRAHLRWLRSMYRAAKAKEEIEA